MKIPKDKETTFRIGNLEFRTTGTHLVWSNRPHTTAEIIQWSGTFCYAIAFWEIDSDGPSLKLVTNRPMASSVNFGTFWTLVSQGQSLLEKFFEESD